MGTASTMACISEALGIAPLGSATAPAVSSARTRIAERTGSLAVELAKNGVAPQQILKRENFENAVRVLHAIGGSTNGIVLICWLLQDDLRKSISVLTILTELEGILLYWWI